MDIANSLPTQTPHVHMGFESEREREITFHNILFWCVCVIFNKLSTPHPSQNKKNMLHTTAIHRYGYGVFIILFSRIWPNQNNILCVWVCVQYLVMVRVRLLNAFNKKVSLSLRPFRLHFFYLICAAIDALLYNKRELHGRFMQFLIIAFWRNDTCLLSIKLLVGCFFFYYSFMCSLGGRVCVCVCCMQQLTFTRFGEWANLCSVFIWRRPHSGCDNTHASVFIEQWK